MNAVSMPMTQPAGDTFEESWFMAGDAVVMGKAVCPMTPAPSVTSGTPDAVG